MSALLGLGNAAAVRSEAPAERTRELYEEYGQRVFTFCNSRLRNREEAQDAAQTTFIYVMRSLERGVVPEFELAWLLKIAFNVCRGTRRSAGHRLAAANKELAEVDQLPDPSSPDGLEANERLEALRDGLRSLPENQRRGILLREWQGLSYAEIADELEVTVGAVETLLFRARRNLTSRLEHVRGSVSALNLGAALLALRSLARGLLVKLALIGATAAVALVPLAAEQALQAHASGERVRPLAVAASTASLRRSPVRSAPAAASGRPAARTQTLAVRAGVLQHRTRPSDTGLTAAGSPKRALPGLPPAGSASAPALRSVDPLGSGQPELQALPLAPPALTPSIELALPALPIALPAVIPSPDVPSVGLPATPLP
jgi:RNA polymerase sigma-70 factor (ECF subfamily)